MKENNINPRIIAYIAFAGSIMGFVESIILTIHEKYSGASIFLLVAFYCLFNVSVFWEKSKEA